MSSSRIGSGGWIESNELLDSPSSLQFHLGEAKLFVLILFFSFFWVWKGWEKVEIEMRVGERVRDRD